MARIYSLRADPACFPVCISFSSLYLTSLKWRRERRITLADRSGFGQIRTLSEREDERVRPEHLVRLGLISLTAVVDECDNLEWEGGNMRTQRNELLFLVEDRS